ncbi:unnamed protein product, partial [Rotaria sordida]
NDKDSSIISNTNKDTKVNFERLLSTTLFSIKSVVSLIATQDLLKNLEETLNYFKSTFNVQKRFVLVIISYLKNQESVELTMFSELYSYQV